MNEKILGKYKITKELSEDEFEARTTLQKLFYIKRVLKTPNEGVYSYIAQNLSEVSHKNLINLAFEEDDKYFYIITEHFEEEKYDKISSDIFIDCNKNVDYERLLKCYLQIFDAISYLHQKGFYHGNINTDNILVDRSNCVFLLDFGKSYLYKMLADDTKFHAPEQLGLIKADTDIKADIFAFGLCVLKLLVETFGDFDFDELYNKPSDLEKIYEKIQEYELEDNEYKIFLLVCQMTLFEPDKRISLEDLGAKLKEILRANKRRYIFELNLDDKLVEKYCEKHSIDSYEIKNILGDKIKDNKSFWEFGKDKTGTREEIKIACGDLIFCCSARNSHYLYCFSILENERLCDKLREDGLELDNEFVITLGRNHCNGCDSVQDYKDLLEEEFRLKQIRNTRLETDKKAVATEEELLRAEKETIDLKKKVVRAKCKSIDKAKDEIIFEEIKIDEEQHSDDEEYKDILEKARAKSFAKSKKSEKRRDLHKVRDLQQNDDVIVKQEKNGSFEQKGEIVKLNPAKQEIIVKFEKYTTNKLELKDKIFTITYDYQIEESLWSKKDKALDSLKYGKTAIPKLLRKINEPKELKENVLIQIDEFLDKNLDENQKDAVIKALSLDNDSEILLIQGPPGTGKTTTITELVRQLLQRHRHYKILVASQSNQAVDNVLEKLYKGEDKICRIGTDESKMSDIAREFTNKKVLDKLLKDNQKRIKEKPISDENSSIAQKLSNLQQDFSKALQNISSKIALSTSKDKNYELATLFTKNIRVFFGTLLGISSWKNFKDMVFDFVIIDEAGRATLSELCVPCIKARKIVFVGDHKQLAPVIDDETADNLTKDFPKQEVGTSFFERFFERLMANQKEDTPYLKNFCHRLVYNYRSEQKICEIYNQPFYDGELKEAPAIKGKREHNLAMFKSSVVWIDTGKREDREDEQFGTGKRNFCNAKLIENTLEILFNEISKANLAHSIGVISPYRAQVSLLQGRLKEIKNKFKEYYKEKTKEDKDLRNGFDIGTVDSFQGSDRDIIIYDCVRSSKTRNVKNNYERQGSKIDFIADEKRLNVSLSRAKKLLIIVGDMDFLYRASVSEGINPFQNIIEFINENKDDYEIIKSENKNGKEKSHK